ncbi:MAG: alpha-1,4-glucan--maltose-1-phosphate maltosyltransferase [Nitrospirae bacterium]|nr:alpha-1,4-glucan--maltose-1-phosphate maltosyltransferase [Nitrospirota bacterium]
MKNDGLFIIENIKPSVDNGKYPVKSEAGTLFKVTATVFRDGHDKIKVNLKHKKKHESHGWESTEMIQINQGLDIWEGSFILLENCMYQYTVEAFTDHFASWLSDTTKKFNAGININSELLEGEILIKNVLNKKSLSKSAVKILTQYLTTITSATNQTEKMKIFSDHRLDELILIHGQKDDLTVHEHIYEVMSDRIEARFAAWYEFFPRSQGNIKGKGSTFKDCIKRLPDIKAMGFNVIYLPPIHPIGKTNRKGPNNSLFSTSKDCGSPYAIGSDLGGHTEVEPALGTIEDFEDFINACISLEMEVALDFAINCSPDHPYVKDHPDWFYKRPDGSIKYAENPPKKYQDIYPLNFRAENSVWKEVWTEMKDVLLFWIKKGVRIFRVDNPHTKPVKLWQWIISELTAVYPDVIFLAEAFTRPPMMRALAKAGFTQSYSYFTWRNFKDEIIEYFTELTQTNVSDYMRANLFANTPDILPTILQTGGRPAFMMRFALASTLSSVYGIYSGYELCENTAIPNSEEYLNSEKYEIKIRDWSAKGNIIDYITKINSIRQTNPALHLYKNLRFHHCDNNNILFYSKSTPDLSNIILIAVNLDPHHEHETNLHIPLEEFYIKEKDSYLLINLLNDEKSIDKGHIKLITLDPDSEPAHIYRLERWSSKEDKFDYFNM